LGKKGLRGGPQKFDKTDICRRVNVRIESKQLRCGGKNRGNGKWKGKCEEGNQESANG